MDKGINDLMPAAETPGGINAAPTSDEKETDEEKARRGHALFEKLKTIISSRTRDVFALGAILKDIRDQELYTALGYETFLEFCADPDLAFHKTTAYAYIQLHEVFILKFGLDFRQIGNIPYGKLLVVVKYATAENVEAMIALARELPIGDLDEEIAFQEIKKTETGEAAEYRTKGEKLFEKYRKLPAADRGDFDREYRRWNKL